MWTAGINHSDPIKDRGIQTSEDFKSYAYSKKFKTSFSNLDGDLVFQFQVKFESRMSCTGGYIKIMSSNFNPNWFNKDTPYLIMFGPDECNGSKKNLHVILNYRGDYYPIRTKVDCPDDMRSHLYRLTLSKGNKVSIYIDERNVVDGDIEDHWNILQPRTINDPSVTKPKDWVEEAYIDDLLDKKPDIWIDIEKIPDPNITKPDDWEYEFDGPWKQPYIENPDFKGHWSPQKVENLKYKGVWMHPQLPNPLYIPDENLYLYSDVGGVAFDLWQVKSGTLFDNILVTSNKQYAIEYGHETWYPLNTYEINAIPPDLSESYNPNDSETNDTKNTEL